MARQRAADPVHEIVEARVLAILEQALQAKEALASGERPITFDRLEEVERFGDLPAREVDVASGRFRFGEPVCVVGQVDPAVIAHFPYAAVEIDRNLALRLDWSRLALHGGSSCSSANLGTAYPQFLRSFLCRRMQRRKRRRLRGLVLRRGRVRRLRCLRLRFPRPLGQRSQALQI